MRHLSDRITKTIGILALAGLAACDYIHDDSLPLCEYHVRFVYDYNMKYADAFQHEVTKPRCLFATTKVISSRGATSRATS